MLTRPLATWIANAAAVGTGPWGDLPQRARHAPCSRPTVDDHARQVQHAVAAEPQVGPPRRQLRDRLRALQAENAQLGDSLGPTMDFPASRRQRFVVTAARGLSLRQIGALLALVVGAAAGPSPSALHRVAPVAGRRAGRVREARDRRGHALILVDCLEEIFFHGRPVLVGVEPASRSWLLGRRAADRTGATWHAAGGARQQCCGVPETACCGCTSRGIARSPGSGSTGSGGTGTGGRSGTGSVGAAARTSTWDCR